MKCHTRTVRIPHHLHDFLRKEAIRISRERGYRKSVNQMFVDLVHHAAASSPEDRPWRW